MEKNSLLIGDEQGLGKTKESIDICVARKKELIKTLIVCGVNSVKYNWEKEIQIHSNEGCVMVDGKTMDVRVQLLLLLLILQSVQLTPLAEYGTA